MPNQSLFDDDVCEHGIKKRWGECEIILSWQPSLAEACVVNSSSLGPSLKSKPFKLQCRMPHFTNSGEPKFHSLHLLHSINHCTDIYIYIYMMVSSLCSNINLGHWLSQGRDHTSVGPTRKDEMALSLMTYGQLFPQIEESSICTITLHGKSKCSQFRKISLFILGC